MLIQELVKHRDKVKKPRLYAERSIRYIVEVDDYGDGDADFSIVDVADSSNSSTKFGLKTFVPFARQGGLINKPRLLSDSADYTFGYFNDQNRESLAQRRHENHLEIIESCFKTTGSNSVKTVLDFLSDAPLENLELPDDFNPKGAIAFSFVNDDERIVTDLESVQKFWFDHCSSDEDENAEKMQCFACGETRVPMKRMRSVIKGIPGGSAVLISANSDAFESYGLKNSNVAPICAECADQHADVLSAMLHQDSPNNIRMGDKSFVFWSRSGGETELMRMLEEPDVQDVESLIESAKTGNPQPEIDDDHFYLTCLSRREQRVVVQNWIDTTLSNVQNNLASWFERQHIPLVNEDRYYGVWKLAYSTARDADKKTIWRIGAELAHSAITGKPVSKSVLHAVVNRCRIERDVTHRRASLIKLALLNQGDEMNPLDKIFDNSTFHSGRLLYVLGSAHQKSVPGITRTVVNRYMKRASKNPSVLVKPLSNYEEKQVPKLRRENRGAYFGIDKDVREITARIAEHGGFPEVSNDEGHFMLGYYHQKDMEYNRISDARKAAGIEKSTTTGKG